MRIGSISRLLSPGFGWCLRCRTTWRFVEGHITRYTDNAGLFPLCEKCWAALTPIERLPFYEQLLQRWTAKDCPVDSMEATQIRDAVRTGL